MADAWPRCNLPGVQALCLDFVDPIAAAEARLSLLSHVQRSEQLGIGAKEMMQIFTDVPCNPDRMPARHLEFLIRCYM